MLVIMGRLTIFVMAVTKIVNCEFSWFAVHLNFEWFFLFKAWRLAKMRFGDEAPAWPLHCMI
jgi:hypothetical protein